MADVLSQSEIDALLQAINTGEVDVDATQDNVPLGQAASYDFRTANRFSREQIRTLALVYENFSRLYSTYLSGTLRSMCEVSVVGVEELKYHEFVNALPTSVLLSVIAMPPLVGPTLLEVPSSLAYAMISRLLGGSGGEDSEITRGFTEIELVLFERITRQFIGLFNEAWQKVIDVRATLERLETSAQFAQIVAMGETVAVVTMNARIGDTEGLINCCLPHLALEPIAKQLNTKVLFQAGGEQYRDFPPITEDIKQLIQKTQLPITAVFNNTAAPVSDILDLRVGDILPLEHRVSQPLTVKVGHLAKFRASLGTQGNRYAVMISGFIREEDICDE
ncbi:MAG: flagellar motor switch protein FliM [Oscillospiraceae bacterium]|nr:flagellar motor switch protein FliM [Oscillospiraceae bacterium]